MLDNYFGHPVLKQAPRAVGSLPFWGLAVGPRMQRNGRWLRILAYSLLLWVGFANALTAQTSYNMTLLGRWDDLAVPAITGIRYNDVIAYAAGGREYAIIGATNGNYVLDVTTPAVPVQRAFLSSSCVSTVWRDHAIYEHFLYVITDNCIGGLQIWDLSPLPSPPVQVYNSTAHFQTAHTLFVNPGSGRLYVAGANTSPDGVLCLDLVGNPAAPTLAANLVLGAYTHDMYVHNDTMYAFMGPNGLASFDLISLTLGYPMGSSVGYAEAGYCHSGWGIANNKYLVFSDETAGKSLKVSNISDPWAIGPPVLFKSALLAPAYTNSIGHNPVGKGNQIYVSYYEDGLQVWDVTTPTAPVRVAYYDTRNNATYNGFQGAWGVDPFLPSGHILVSDVNDGLFILQQNTLVPVGLTNFHAVAQNQAVQLAWTTQTEVNNEGFWVERSADGEQFEKLIFVPSPGHSATALDYEALDTQPMRGISYYRLRQVDFDGNFNLSNVVSVDFGNAGPQMVVFPSPAHIGESCAIQVEIHEPTEAALMVYDVLGKRLHQESLRLQPGIQELELPIAALRAGVYLIRLECAQLQMEQKLILTN